jgi:uncharacterized protein (TIGR02722 family)
MQSKYLAAIVTTLAISLTGCQTMGVVSSNKMTSDDGTAMDSFGLVSEDFEFAAQQAVAAFMKSPASTRPDGTRWRVTIGDVVNDTTFRINTRSMTSRMRDELINSGKFSFSGFTGQDRTSFLSDSQQLAKSSLVDKKTVAKGGTAQAPNLEIAGQIRQTTNVSGDRDSQRLDFEFDFRALDVVTGQLAFTKVVTIKKKGSNSNFAW